VTAVVVDVEARLIPETTELPVVRPLVPPRMLSAVAFPMVFPEIVSEVAIPETLMPETPPATAAVTPDD
jgi:hypothetical protein